MNPEDVRVAYRMILGREPESEEVVSLHARQYPSLDELRCALLASEEFHRFVAPSSSFLHKSLNGEPIEVEIDASPSQLSAMMRRVESQWQRLGSSEPHWSVFTADEFRAAHIKDTEAAFYETGRGFIECLQQTAERCGVSLSGFRDCFELGCGVGRLTVWLAGLFERVVAADISPPHLALAREALDRFDRRNVHLLHLASFDAIETTPQFDVFISVIVLQHNPPPLIAMLLRAVLKKLRPGGIAYFQVPTYAPLYHFHIDEYLNSSYPENDMEMHVIPQHQLFDIIQKSGCRLLECREDTWTGDYKKLSNSVLVRKQQGG